MVKGKIYSIISAACIAALISACSAASDSKSNTEASVASAIVEEAATSAIEESDIVKSGSIPRAAMTLGGSASAMPGLEASATVAYPSEDNETSSTRTISWNSDWKYADKSRIHSGTSTLYIVSERAKTIAVNAGHGTSGGSSVKTLCHPDGSPKVTGGSTSQGSVSAIAVSGGTTLLDGTPEPQVTLKLALLVKDRLLKRGYNVLMIRESDDVQLDNVARTIMANNNADAHISLHYDSTESDKGFFYIGVPNDAGYRSMEPVASHYQEHNLLGESILSGMKSAGAKVYSSGSMALDLTQTSYSTIPSVDLEVGDRKSDHSQATQSTLAEGIAIGIDDFFK